jgi:3-deoxy-D-manno-octulosonate 8-phosphate phosphatase (KDO 8-P phosphatase)
VATAAPSKTSKSPRSKSLPPSLGRIRLFATDVDGVLTDAGMYYSESGDELKKFNTRDGMGIKLLQAAGLVTAIITKEKTAIVERRGAKLAIPEVHQGVEDKLSVLRQIAARHGLTLAQAAYIGDDVNDLEALQAAGFSAAPADAIPAVLKCVDYVCTKKGGEGAVRELADLILGAQVDASRRSLHVRLKRPGGKRSGEG